MMTPLTKRNISVVDVSITPRLSHKAGDSPHWIPSKLSATSAACTSGFIHARDLFDLMSSELGTSRASSPRVSLALPRSSRSRRRVETQAMSRRVSVSSSSSSVHSSSGWDDSSSMPSIFMSICGIDSAYSVRLFLWFRTYPTTGRSSQSPPLDSRDGGIRLLNTPLSDIASLRSVPGSPCKAATSLD